MLYSCIRGVEVWITDEVEREIGVRQLAACRCRFAPRAPRRAYFFGVSCFRPAASGTGKALPCMILPPPPRGNSRAFRLVPHKIRSLHSIKVTVPAESSPRYIALLLLSHGQKAVLLKELTIMPAGRPQLFIIHFSLFIIHFFSSLRLACGVPPSRLSARSALLLRRGLHRRPAPSKREA